MLRSVLVTWEIPQSTANNIAHHVNSDMSSWGDHNCPKNNVISDTADGLRERCNEICSFSLTNWVSARVQVGLKAFPAHSQRGFSVPRRDVKEIPARFSICSWRWAKGEELDAQQLTATTITKKTYLEFSTFHIYSEGFEPYALKQLCHLICIYLYAFIYILKNAFCSFLFWFY